MSAAKTEAQRLRLIRLAQSAGLPVRDVLRLARDEMDTLEQDDDAVVLAYARALLSRADRQAGHVPRKWCEVRHCAGCGPVWLWPTAPAHVIACPWCWNRVEGLPVPCVADGL